MGWMEESLGPALSLLLLGLLFGYIIVVIIGTSQDELRRYRESKKKSAPPNRAYFF